MSWLLSSWKWILVGVVGLLVVATLWYKGLADKRKAELEAVQIALKVTADSLHDVTAAAERCGADLRDGEARHHKALSTEVVEEDRLRALLRECNSDEAIAHRAAGMFP